MNENKSLNKVADEEKCIDGSCDLEGHYYMDADEYEKFVEKIESRLPRLSENKIKEDILRMKNEIRNL